ncbi:nucleotidyltransferase family protein [Bradyrhizobium sp.]|uniref:nucleotidyltransferase family protein n=1 Tax=Bradyrhizobium sp. TaxID=376 RepID=UPI003C766040
MKDGSAPDQWQSVFLRACAALSPSDWAGREDAIRRLDGTGWKNISSAAERYGLTGLVSRGLDWAHQELGVSIPVRESLARFRQGQLLQLLARRSAAREVTNVLAARKIDFVVYKGVALADEVYGDLSLRAYGDCDILVRPDDADAAFNALCELGFAPSASTNVAQQIANRTAAIAVKRPELSVDLHWTLSADDLFMKDTDIIWAHCTPPEGANALPGRRMSPELMLVNLAEHFCRHSFIELKPLVDFHIVAVKCGPRVDPDRLHRLARSLRLDSMVDLTARLSENLLLPHPMTGRLKHDRPGIRTRVACAVLTERAIVRTRDPLPTESRLRRLAFGGSVSATLRAFRTMLLPRVRDLEGRFQRPFDLRMYPQYYAIQMRRVLTRSRNSFDRHAGLAPASSPPSRRDGE